MSKERLEEIKKLRETILEENDFRTRCVLANVFVGLGYIDYLIKQAERVQELENHIDHLYDNNVHLKGDYRLQEQNKRYREALESIKELGEWGMFTDKYARIAQKALEGEE